VKEEIIHPGRGTILRKNDQKELRIILDSNHLDNIFLINGNNFYSQNLTKANLIVKPNDCYMLINKCDEEIEVNYSNDFSNHRTIYDPYKFELSEKPKIDPILFKKKYNVPNGFLDVLNKWYSIKFTYSDYSLIYIKPGIGISIQTHKFRSEVWRILKGKPIIINANKVYYFVEAETKFINDKLMYHSILNPNNDPEQFVIVEERWSGNFNEEDIVRVYNPNNYS
jgi:mannose-6-phosphate isomerase-like protein (cupin superfamily)